MNDTSPHPSEHALHRKLQRVVGKTLAEFQMIEQGDAILIGLSGGKDSLALVDLLGERLLRAQGRFTLHAVHIAEQGIGYEARTDYLAGQCQRYGIPFHTVTIQAELDRHTDRSPCFLCAWNRRKALFAQARHLGCTKIALGHHLDDIVATTLLNLTFNGRFDTMPARLDMRKFKMSIIRPLAHIPETWLKEWAEFRRYSLPAKRCPYEHSSMRQHIKDVTAHLEQLTPDYRSSIWRALVSQHILLQQPDTDKETASLA